MMNSLLGFDVLTKSVEDVKEEILKLGQYSFDEYKDFMEETQGKAYVKSLGKKLYNMYLNTITSDYKDKYREIFNFITGISKTALIMYFCNKKLSGSDITKNYTNGIVRTENNSKEKVNILDGYIYVPVNDDDLDILRKKSSGTCTILDGGLVSIEGIFEEYEINDTDLIMVGDISTDKITYNKEKDEIKD